uniref:Uncharacterized protein F n=1 Tax=Human respiratory syncytial virus A (strain A2) TaxID=11259 RepID=Q82017_HRSVA|nr:unknown protein [Human orthopneumovirus]
MQLPQSSLQSHFVLLLVKTSLKNFINQHAVQLAKAILVL